MNHVRSRPAPNDAPVRLRQNYLKRVAAGSWTRPFKADHDMSVTPEKSVRARATLQKIGFVLTLRRPKTKPRADEHGGPSQSVSIVPGSDVLG